MGCCESSSSYSNRRKRHYIRQYARNVNYYHVPQQCCQMSCCPMTCCTPSCCHSYTCCPNRCCSKQCCPRPRAVCVPVSQQFPVHLPQPVISQVPMSYPVNQFSQTPVLGGFSGNDVFSMQLSALGGVNDVYGGYGDLSGLACLGELSGLGGYGDLSSLACLDGLNGLGGYGGFFGLY